MLNIKQNTVKKKRQKCKIYEQQVPGTLYVNKRDLLSYLKKVPYLEWIISVNFDLRLLNISCFDIKVSFLMRKNARHHIFRETSMSL